MLPECLLNGSNAVVGFEESSDLPIFNCLRLCFNVLVLVWTLSTVVLCRAAHATVPSFLYLPPVRLRIVRLRIVRLRRTRWTSTKQVAALQSTT
jgi:hypothetical protein